MSWERLLAFAPHPDVWLLIGGLVVGYLAALRRHPEPRGGAPRWQVVAYLAGVAMLWLGADWPIDDVAERSLLSVHMVQYLLLSMIAPGLLLLGLPRWLVDRLLAPMPLRRLARALARPWLAWGVFNTVLLVTHTGPVVELYLRNDVVHLAMHVGWVASGLIMWWPVLSPLEDCPRLSRPLAMAYLFAQSIVPTIPASFLTYTDQPVFAAYAALPKPPGVDVAFDQQLAGALMKTGGAVVLWSVIVVIFFRWAAAHERAEQQRRPRLHDRTAGTPPSQTVPDGTDAT